MVRRLKDVLSRLRAALTPQAVALLAAALLLCWLAAASQRTGASPLEERLARTLSCMEGAGRVEVTIGMQNDDFVEITSGLKEGDTVYYTESQSLTIMDMFTMAQGMGGGMSSGGSRGGQMPGGMPGKPSGMPGMGG